MTAYAVILGPCSCVPELRLRRPVQDSRFLRRCRLSRGPASMGDDRAKRIQLGRAHQSSNVGIVAGIGRDGHLQSGLEARICRVAVIGAGAAGLVAARELAREGHEVVVYEQSGFVGGVWVYDPRVEDDLLGTKTDRTRVQGSMYESLRTNLPRELMGFLDFPFLPTEGRDPRRYPGHEEVRLYLQDFAEEFGVMRLVRFDTEVEDVSPVVKDVDGGAGNACREDAFQKMWDTADRIDGSVVGDTRELARPLFERSVVNGVQGLDLGGVEPQVPAQWVVKSRRIVGEKADDAAEEFFDAVVVCNGHYSEPKIATIPGIESWPGTVMHSHNYRVPAPFRDQVVVLVGAAASGEDISREVATVAKEVYLSARSWSSSLDLSKPDSRHGNLWRRPLIESVSADGAVRFKDGSTVFANTIMFCTGYVYSFPFLHSQGCVSVEENQVGPLYQHVFPPALAPTLSFVGLPYKVVPFPLCELQSKWIAKVLSGKLSLPPAHQMMAAVQNFYASLKAHGLPKRYTHNADTYQFAYVSWLAEQCGCEVDWWRAEMYTAGRESKRTHPATYRDEWNDHELMRAAYSSLTPEPPIQSVT